MSSYPGDERYAMEQPNRARQDAPPIDVAGIREQAVEVRDLGKWPHTDDKAAKLWSMAPWLASNVAALLSAYEAREKEIETLRAERDEALQQTDAAYQAGHEQGYGVGYETGYNDAPSGGLP